MFKKFAAALASTFLWSAPLLAEETTGTANTTTAASTAQDSADISSEEEHFQRWSALPVIGYSEETELQYGAMGILFFKPSEKGGKVSEIDVTAYGSTRGQFQFFFCPYFYLYHDQISGWLDLRYQNWVASYFGMGNDPDYDVSTTFDRQMFYFGAELESTVGVPREFKYGAELHIEYADIEFHKGGELELPDAHSGWRNGLGYLIAYDTRDNTNWTRHGFLAQWQQMFFSDHLGDYSFDVEKLDIRGFTELFWDASMAVGFLWQRSGGDAPFDLLAGPDGIKRFRGVESLYFRDEQALILQAELRKFLGWRLAGTIFFEGGKVGDHFSELLRNKWHYGLGFGGQLALNLKEQLYARGEFSWIDFDHLGITVYIRHAF